MSHYGRKFFLQPRYKVDICRYLYLSPNYDQDILFEYEDDTISDFLKDSNEKWILNGQRIKLFKDKLVRKSAFTDDLNLFFEHINAFVYEGLYGFPIGCRDYKIFRGLFVEINLKHLYKGPIVFAKKGLFNGRKGLKKVQLPYRDTYFNVWSNDEVSVQKLYSKDVPTKLLRLKDQLGINKVEASFLENKLYIALYTPKNLFAPVAIHAKDIREYEAFYDNIKQIEDYCAQFRDL